MKLLLKIIAVLALVSVLWHCSSMITQKIDRPLSPWVFRSVLDQQPRMLTKGFGTYRKGHIALQDHGDRVAFRNIKIREL